MTGLLHSSIAVGDKLPNLSLSVTTTGVIAGAMASRDYSPLHHDYHYVTTEAGHRDIFLNTPTQASLFERYLSDWSGPRGRLGRMRFNMTASVYAGDSISLDGEVVETTLDEQGCGWLTLRLSIAVDGQAHTTCEVRYALPLDEQDNPWTRRDKEWMP